MTRGVDLDAAVVADYMHTGVLVCAPEAALVDVAGMTAENGVAHLVVSKAHPERPLGVLSTLDLARALSGD